jgi:hypothetical protein
MHKLEQLLFTKIIDGLQRNSIVRCSDWSCRYRMMGQPYPGPWTFKYHPWLREMHDCEADLIVGRKAAQMGFTETALNMTFFAIDNKGYSVLYVLPSSTPDAADFSSSRFDPALENSEYLSNIFSDVKNVGHKRAGDANLFIRGSKSRNQLKSLPVARLFLDELDEMEQENIPLALERLSGQHNKQVFMLSTPTVKDTGIDEYYTNSSQDHFMFPCPMCQRHIELSFPDCLVITHEDYNNPLIEDTHIICPACHGVLKHTEKPSFLAKGEWVSMRENVRSRGFYINQLYSSTIKPHDIAISFLKSQSDPFHEQEFFNSKLGLPHTIEGAQIQESDLLACRTNKHKVSARQNDCFTTMGIDVGAKWLHFEIDRWEFRNAIDLHTASKVEVLNEGKVEKYEELDAMMRDFCINFAVIDANPEGRNADDFCRRFPGRTRKCYYKELGKLVQDNPDHRYCVVDRTMWMDRALVRFRNQTISLPMDLSFEYKQQIVVPVRSYELDKDGNRIARYLSGTKADHHAHARTYAEIAAHFGAGLGSTQDIIGD